MEHIVEVSYRRHRLMLIELEHAGRIERGVVLDVFMDDRYKGGLRGIVSESDLLGRGAHELADPQFVALVARCAAQGLRIVMTLDSRALTTGGRPTVICDRYMSRDFGRLAPPVAGAVVLRFTTKMSSTEEHDHGIGSKMPAFADCRSW